MDFERVLKTLLEEFEQKRVRCALMGGVALGVWGAPRATLDIDFLVHHDDLCVLHEAMHALGYDRVVFTENISQYRHEAPGLGFVDFVHAFRRISLEMLGRAVERPVFGGTRQVRVLLPEDVIGLKVQAMVNDPENRKAQDSADIEALMEARGAALDWDRVGEFYRLFSLEQEGRRLWERFSHA
ncbi:MAG: nucleotidyl transferase AbiEii/AbiGii toxin family protein [Elusimicrobia bacterium]|nr:nucleotidyl transferase AbiEii/AbiGii toxin family protein [Elusimicrobiota bacterium]